MLKDIFIIVRCCDHSVGCYLAHSITSPLQASTAQRLSANRPFKTCLSFFVVGGVTLGRGKETPTEFVEPCCGSKNHTCLRRNNPKLRSPLHVCEKTPPTAERFRVCRTCRPFPAIRCPLQISPSLALRLARHALGAHFAPALPRGGGQGRAQRLHTSRHPTYCLLDFLFESLECILIALNRF